MFAPLEIAGTRYGSHVVLAPMCGVCDQPYLEICREVDPASILATEMVSAPALANGGRNTTEMIDFQSVAGPVMIQIFGHDPAKWDEFRRRYVAELDHQSAAWQPIREAAHRGDVTLLYSAHDTEHNNAVALQAYLEQQLKETSHG